MSSWAAEIRQREAAQRREERETYQRQKDLERRIKELTKMSEREQARLEVALHESAIEELLSVHKEHGTRIDWTSYVAALPPHEPLRSGRHEFAALLAHGIASLDNVAASGSAEVEAARSRDEQECQSVRDGYAKKHAEWLRMRSLAKRVLAGQSQAYSEVISEFSPFAEIAVLGSSIHFTVHSPKVIGCVLAVNGQEIIPAEAKSLTAAGKLSVKAMLKQRFHEIYQDYVCGCALRLARELFALLPASVVLVTACVKERDERTGKMADLPVLSVAIDRQAAERLNFEQLDPSDSMENFVCRGDAKASRKSGKFVPIVPLAPEDLAPSQPERLDFSGLLKNMRQLREEIGSKLKPASPAAEAVASETPPTV